MQKFSCGNRVSVSECEGALACGPVATCVVVCVYALSFVTLYCVLLDMNPSINPLVNASSIISK